MYVPVSQRKDTKKTVSPRPETKATTTRKIFGSSRYVPVSERTRDTDTPKPKVNQSLRISTPRPTPKPKSKVDLSFLRGVEPGPSSTVRKTPAQRREENRVRSVEKLRQTALQSPLREEVISQGEVDPVEEARARGRDIPFVGEILSGTGPQGITPEFPKGSIRQSLVEKGIVGFITEGFQKKFNPTDAEIGEQIDNRYQKLIEEGLDDNRALEVAVQDVINQAPGDATNIADLKNPEIDLTKEEKSALRFTNLLEDVFAVLDAPFFVGSTKVAKGPIVEALKLADKTDDVTTVLKNLKISDEVIGNIAPKIAKSTNEIDIAKIIDDALKGTKKKVPIDETGKTKSIFATKEVVEEVAEEIPGVKIASKTDLTTTKKIDALVKADPKNGDRIPVAKIFKNERFDVLAEKASKRFTDIDDHIDETIGFENLATKKVKISDIVPTQKIVTKENLKRVIDLDELKLPGEDRIRAYEIDGKLFLRDGHHRVATSILEGKTSIELAVFKESDLPTLKSVPDIGTKPAVQKVPRANIKNIPDDDLGEILDFIDAVGKKTDPTVNNQIAVRRLAERYGINPNQANGRISSAFKKAIEGDATVAKKVAKGPRAQPKKPAKIDVKKIVKDVKEKSGRVKRSKERKTTAEAKSKLTPEEVSKRSAKARRAKADTPQVRSELDQRKLEVEFKKDAVDANPARQLSKFAPKAGEHRGSLPEVTGVGTSKFAREGDDIVKELGFKDSETAREAFDQYQKDRADLAEMIEEVKSHTKDYQDEQKVLSALKRDIAQEGDDRRRQIQTVKEFFTFNDTEFNKILKKSGFTDPRLMSDAQFTKFMDKLRGEGEAMFRAIERRVELQSIIYEKDFKKVENLFRSQGLPKMENMTKKQIESLIETMETFKHGDEFLGVRQLETVKNTDIKDVRTIREALEALAKDAGVSVESLEGITYKEWDKYAYDSALAQKNPFYDVMVTETNRAFLQAGENTIRIRNRLDDLIGSARKSRPRTFLQKAVPTDERIFNWLETDALGRVELAKDMTAEELEAGHYIRTLYEQARDYLIQQQTLKKYRSDYITHIRRGFLEAWKDDGLLKAIRESFEQYKQDEAIFDILDGRTGDILPLEKFFQFSMTRTGGLTPSKNVAQAVEKYFTTFERKVALDSLVPKIDIYAHSLSPRNMSERGLELDQTLKTFVRKWVNSKKGRVADTEIAKPGGRVDWGLRSIIGLTRMIDLGFSVPTGVASFVGEQAATFTALGLKKHALGTTRMNTKRGREILRQNEAFIGESTFTKLKGQASGVGDKFMTGMFALFGESARLANSQYLLSNLTEQEWKTGVISTQRLAEFKKDMGRYRVVEGAESVIGKTAPGKLITQYKSWAIPIMHTTKNNLEIVLQAVKKDGFKKAMQKKETAELFRSAMLASSISLTVGGYANSLKKKKDKNFAEELLFKAYRDSMTIVGALDPTLMASEPRALSFIVDMVQGLTDIISFEKGLLHPQFDRLKSGKDEGEIRGVRDIKTLLSPKAVTQIIPEKKKKKPTSKDDRFPDFPDFPSRDLPNFPQFPSI